MNKKEEREREDVMCFGMARVLLGEITSSKGRRDPRKQSGSIDHVAHKVAQLVFSCVVALMHASLLSARSVGLMDNAMLESKTRFTARHG